MSNRYTNEELNIIGSSLYDGMPVDELHSLLFPRKKTAIVKKVQYFGYGVKTIDGVQCFYEGLKSRTRRTKEEIAKDLSSEKKTIVGKPRVAGTTLEPTTSECFENKSDDIVADNTVDVTKTTILDVYEEINTLLYSENHSLLQSLTATLTGGPSITVSKDSL